MNVWRAQTHTAAQLLGATRLEYGKPDHGRYWIIFETEPRSLYVKKLFLVNFENE